MGEVTKTKTEDRSKTASFIRGIQKEYSKISWTSSEDVVKQTSAV
ncbi:MAG: preprotein translocase subunit SecE, partial [Lachnospiraceae bacterium]|nr:preprotein translocase subunit SecE [Lachnospiraceae bacterium]